MIGTLISLFDTKDIFVKEFQNVLGERLLQPDINFDKEVKTAFCNTHVYSGQLT